MVREVSWEYSGDSALRLGLPGSVTVIEPMPARPSSCVGWVMLTVTLTVLPATDTVPVWPAAAR
ncbi:hypothetical protein GCM10018954_019210 [Kutzneria kofuensis]